MESKSGQSSKLFDKRLKANYFSQLKKTLNPNHKVYFVVCLRKFRTGKSTFLNIFLCLVKKEEYKIIYLKEEENVNTVTSGTDFFIYSDTNNKIDYVFIDCEGSGNYNSVEVMKLYLLIACISYSMFFNVDKAFDDQTLNNFISQIISHLEMLKIKVFEIHILIRDAGKIAMENYLNQQ
jgi:hypothetical protein